MTIKAWMAGVVLVGLSAISLPAEILTLEDTQGRKIEAKITSFDGRNVTFTRVGSEKSYTLDVDKLTEATQDNLIALDVPREVERVKAISLPNKSFLPIKFSSGKTSKRTNRRTYDDERTETLSPTVHIENKDSNTDLSCKMTVAVFGRGVVQKRTIKVLAKKVFDVNIKGGTENTFALEEFSIKYDRDWSQYGYKYQGYAVVLHDEENKVLRVVASPKGYQTQARKVFKIEVGKLYDTELINEVPQSR